MGYNSVADITGLLHSFSRGCLPNSRNRAKFRQNLTLQQFRVIQGHRCWCQSKAHVQLLLVTNSNFGRIWPFSRYWRLKLENRWIFATDPCLRPPFEGNPLEFGDQIWRQKTRVLGLPDSEEIMTLAFFVFTEYRRVTDGQTDRRTDGHTRCDRYYPR